MFLEILQYSQEITCVCSLFNEVACNFIKKGIQHMCFPVNIVIFLRAAFLYRTPSMTASGASSIYVLPSSGKNSHFVLPENTRF